MDNDTMMKLKELLSKVKPEVEETQKVDPEVEKAQIVFDVLLKRYEKEKDALRNQIRYRNVYMLIEDIVMVSAQNIRKRINLFKRSELIEEYIKVKFELREEELKFQLENLTLDDLKTIQ
jgi:hypothetical protein